MKTVAGKAQAGPKKNFVAVDIGTSETRVSVNGVNTLRIPNNFVFLEKPTPATFTAGEGVLGNLEAHIEGLEDEMVYVLLGEMAARYSVTNQHPSPMMAKHKQRINLASIIVGAAVSRFDKGGNKDTELFIALPPIECGRASRSLVEQLVGEYKVTFPKLGRVARVAFTNVHCFEESRMAGVAFMEQLTDEVKQGTVLSVDIGAGTTDLALFQNGQFREYSAKTYKVGGNTAREFLIDLISDEYDFEPKREEADGVIASGVLKMGNSKVSVTHLVNEAKGKFAITLVERIQQYFRDIECPIQTVNAFLVSGGGSMAGGDKKARSTVSFVIDALSKVCPGVNTIAYDGDARLANLNGLCATAKTIEIPDESNDDE